ncbi:GNAT family N-acetyltransferase [Novipirellula caenicola]
MFNVDRPKIIVRTERDATSDASQQTRVWLRDHNWRTNHDFMKALSSLERDSTPLCLAAFLEDTQVGGLIATTHLRWLKISIMSVHPESQRIGIGSRLLQTAESIARARGCCYAYVDAMANQSPDFYPSCGYTTAGIIPDWDSHGHAKYIYYKKLPDPGSA